MVSITFVCNTGTTVSGVDTSSIIPTKPQDQTGSESNLSGSVPSSETNASGLPTVSPDPSTVATDQQSTSNGENGGVINAVVGGIAD